jgi:hypothetical protein
VQGTLQLQTKPIKFSTKKNRPALLDTFQLISRLIVNFSIVDVGGIAIMLLPALAGIGAVWGI